MDWYSILPILRCMDCSHILAEPPGLCIGKVKLADEMEVLGVLGETFLCEGECEITNWGGWRAYCQRVK